MKRGLKRALKVFFKIMSTLYRDYRPKNFAEVLGQNHIKLALQNELAAGNPAQAYIFCGPRAVGKTTLARIITKSLNCEKRATGDFEPCNQCSTCLGISAGQNLDVIEIDAASNTGVDNVRENIIAFSRLAPVQAKFKVFIIDEVHMLSISAFNALLKILEEPPSYVVFILCTTEIHKVPSTVVSRCERYDFKRISIAEIIQKLTRIALQEQIKVDPEVLEAVARRSGGHLRDAESLLGQVFSLGGKSITAEQAELALPRYNSHEALDLLEHLGHKDAVKAIILINNLVDSGASLKNFTGEIVNLLRKLMIGKLSSDLSDKLGLDAGANLEKRLLQIGEQLSSEQILLFTRRFLDLSLDRSGSSNIAQLPLELLIAELCLDYSDPFQPPNSPLVSSLTNSTSSLASPIKPRSAALKINSEKEIPPTPNNFKLSCEEVEAKWPEFLVKIKKFNHSLSFVLQNCEQRGLKGARLILAFKYKFHKERLSDVSIKKILDEVLAEVYCPGLSFEAILDEGLKTSTDNSVSDAKVVSSKTPPLPANLTELNHPPASGLMGDLIKTFGGEVIGS